jgi:alkanesulfonate monooxygenase SsuD/methylene tetrahydromethanopterin reductase-like flavin-dependent oxidoreductase (luciferase family)
MRCGLFYLPSSLPATRAEGAERFRTIIDQIVYGEEIGFDSVWLAEHSFSCVRGDFFFTDRHRRGDCAENEKDAHRHGRAALALS